MGKIKLKNIRIYANHGCLNEEALIGSDYIVHLEVKADLLKAAHTDALEDTVDYVQLQSIVRREMAIRAKLLEHVAKRIVDAVLKEVTLVTQVKVSVSKKNPPIGGDVSQVQVVIKGKR